jgi:hypothetical protein
MVSRIAYPVRLGYGRDEPEERKYPLQNPSRAYHCRFWNRSGRISAITYSKAGGEMKKTSTTHLFSTTHAIFFFSFQLAIPMQ